jgi:hypothetical protein
MVRPYTDVAISPRISGRRFLGQVLTLVTFFPWSKTSRSGKV